MPHDFRYLACTIAKLGLVVLNYLKYSDNTRTRVKGDWVAEAVLVDFASSFNRFFSHFFQSTTLLLVSHFWLLLIVPHFDSSIYKKDDVIYFLSCCKN